MISTCTSTRISAPARPLPLSRRAAQAQSSAIRDLLEQAKRPGMISLAGGLPDSSLFPLGELADIARRAIVDDGRHNLQYGLTQGDESARMALTALFGAGTDPDSLLVTTGSQQALDLIGRAVLDPGDQIVVGDPDYLGALQAFRSHGAELVPVAVDADGIDTDRFECLLGDGLRPKGCYIVPHFHNPTGATMAASRRAHLAELSSRYGFLVIEDDPYRELFYDDRPPTECESDPGLTVRLRSTSKTLAPGLRVGVTAGPSWLIDAMVTAKQSGDLHTSSLSQAIVAAAAGASWFPAHLDGLRAAYRHKRDVLCAALDAEFGVRVRFAAPAGGMFVWATFADVDDSAGWLERCLDTGVCFVPGAAFAVQRDIANCVRLSFATGSRDELSEGIRRMAAARA